MVLVLISMLISALLLPAAVALNADDARDLSEHLTIHYDFRGSTDAERLKDKATAGNAQDDLTIPEGKSDIFTLTDGSVEQNTTLTNGFGVSVYADSSADILESGQGEGTWFIRFRATAPGDYSLLDLRKNGNGRPLCVQLLSSGTIRLLQSDVNSPDSYQEVGSMNIKYDFTKGEWCNVYIQRYLYLEEYYHYKAYVSYGGSTALTASSTEATGWVIGNKTNGLTPTSYPLGLFTQYGQTWPTVKGLSYDDVRYYNVALTEEEMQGILSDAVFCENIGGGEGEQGETDAVEQITYDRSDLDSCMILHYDFKGTTNALRLADKATSGTVKDNLVIKEGTSSAYTFSNGTVKLNSSINTYLYAPASDDLVRANMGEGSWFARFSATAAPAADWMVILDLRQNSISRGFFLALRPDGKLYIAASSGTSPTDGKQLNPVEGFTYAFDGEMINLFAVRSLTDGKYSYTLYYSKGDSTDFEKITEWVICDAASGLASTEDIPLGIYNQANVTWPAASGMIIDDIRCYVVPLTAEEMASVIINLDADPGEEENPGYGQDEEGTDDFEHHYREPETSRSAEFSTAEPGFDPGTPTTPEMATENAEESERVYDTTEPDTSSGSTVSEDGKDSSGSKKGCSSGLALLPPAFLIVGIFTCVNFKKNR